MILIFRCPSCANRMRVNVGQPIALLESTKGGLVAACARCKTPVDFSGDRPRLAKLTRAQRVELAAATAREIRRIRRGKASA